MFQSLLANRGSSSTSIHYPVVHFEELKSYWWTTEWLVASEIESKQATIMGSYDKLKLQLSVY